MRDCVLVKKKTNPNQPNKQKNSEYDGNDPTIPTENNYGNINVKS